MLFDSDSCFTNTCFFVFFFKFQNLDSSVARLFYIEFNLEATVSLNFGWVSILTHVQETRFLILSTFSDYLLFCLKK